MSATITHIGTSLTEKPEETISWWHRFHRWTKWVDGTTFVAYRGRPSHGMKDIQTRRCVKCNKKQERFID